MKTCTVKTMAHYYYYYDNVELPDGFSQLPDEEQKIILELALIAKD